VALLDDHDVVVVGRTDVPDRDAPESSPSATCRDWRGVT
jgi:hypothetical protein